MSKEAIISALPEEFVRQMRDWVRSRCGNGFAMTSAYDGLGPSSGYAETMIPILYGAVGDIDTAMADIPLREREAVRLFWEREGNSLRWLGRRLNVNHETVEQRVRQGHAMLLEELRIIRLNARRYNETAQRLGAFS